MRSKPAYNYAEIIKRIVDTAQEYLNDWEIEFIASVYDRCVLQNVGLSEAQKDKVLQINRKVLGRR